MNTTEVFELPSLGQVVGKLNGRRNIVLEKNNIFYLCIVSNTLFVKVKISVLVPIYIVSRNKFGVIGDAHK